MVIRTWDPLWVFLVIVGIGLGLVGLARDNQKHIVSYTVEKDEVAVSKTMFFRRKIHRQAEVVVFNERYASLNVYKTRGSVKLVNNPTKTVLSGSCWWNGAFRFGDGVRAALCGEVEYELSQADKNILAVDKAGGDAQVVRLVKKVLLHSASFCGSSTTSLQVYNGGKKPEFLRCVEQVARSTAALQAFEGLSLRTFRIKGLEYQNMAPDPLDRSRRWSGGYI